MNPADQKTKLTENLNKAIALDNIYQSADFQNVLLPVLQELSKVQVIDPASFKGNREEFGRACDIAMTKAVVHQDLIKLLSSQKETMASIRKQLVEPTKNWSQ
jgi:hypothetical protein